MVWVLSNGEEETRLQEFLLSSLYSFDFICSSLVWIENLVDYYGILGRLWVKRAVREQVWFVPENSWVVWLGGCSASPGKLCNFYPHLSLITVFPALKVPQNYYIMTSGSSTQHIYPAWKAILTIWQNMKASEFQKSQFPSCVVNWEKLGSTV